MNHTSGAAAGEREKQRRRDQTLRGRDGLREEVRSYSRGGGFKAKFVGAYPGS